VSSPQSAPRRRPRLQFSLLGLMIVTLVLALTLTPVYYLMRSFEGQPHLKLVGYLAMFVGPLLLTIVCSFLLAGIKWWLGR
jgi:hypothetical protein